ncbi:hypothetical protein HDU76_002559 [Blyttiomyces sp. JEL0837]|nr:hypothetical protein HDU76_002559 [Blyttiomyces sp. JEL0837]
MSDREALALLAEAEKCANYKGWFGANKLDEASELYAKAGNCFKLAKKFKEAGDAYMSQGYILCRMGEKDEASSAYINASKAFKKTNPLEAINAMGLAVQILTERGRFAAAASNQKQVAEMYETDLNDLQKACEAYEKAAEWYQGEDSHAQADSCLLKVATFYGQLERYDEAVDTFETVASHCVDNKLTKWSMKEYFLKSGICLLCLDDPVRFKNSMEKYQQMDVTFEQTREYKFLVGLQEAVDSGDVEAFTNVIVEYDKLTKLDNWKTSLLLKVKKTIGEEEGLT